MSAAMSQYGVFTLTVSIAFVVMRSFPSSSGGAHRPV